MLWAYVFAGATGFLLGLRYRVPALLAASALAVLASPAVIALAAIPVWQALAMIAGTLAILQCGYLAGLVLLWAVVWSKQREPSVLAGPASQSAQITPCSERAKQRELSSV